MVSFIHNKENKCPEGWKEVEAAKGRLIRGTIVGAEVGKFQGTPMKDKTSPLHNHKFKIGVNLKVEPVVALRGQNRSVIASNKEYSIEGATRPSDGNLPFIQFLVCEQHQGFPVEQAMHQEMVAFFNDPQCPDQWEPYEKLNKRFAVPLPSDAKDSDFYATVGPTPNGDISHIHSITVVDGHSNKPMDTVKIIISPQSLALSKRFWPFKENKAYGNHIVPDRSFTSEKGNTTVPFIQFLACRKTTGRHRTSKLPVGMLGFITAEYCPDHWEPNKKSMGRYLVGLPSGKEVKGGETFGSSSLKSKEFRQHRHHLETSIKLPGLGIAGLNGCCARGYARAGTYGMRGSTGSSPSGLPYVQLRHCIVTDGNSSQTEKQPIQQ